MNDDKYRSLLKRLPESELLRGHLLMEVGELEEGYRVLGGLAEVMKSKKEDPAYAAVKWHMPVALSQMVRADYVAAAETWEEQLSLFDRASKAPQMAKALMSGLPLVPAIDSQVGGQFPVWPLTSLTSAQLPLNVVSSGRYQPTLLAAIADIEAGNVSNARFVLEKLIANGGEHSLRPLASIYYEQLARNGSELVDDTTVDPWEEFVFPGDESKDEESEDSATQNTSGSTDGDEDKTPDATTNDDSTDPGEPADDDSATASDTDTTDDDENAASEPSSKDDSPQDSSATPDSADTETSE